MDQSLVIVWLRKRIATDAAASFLSGTLILSGGVIIVALSFGAAWAVVWLVSWLGVESIGSLSLNRPAGLPAGVQLVGAALVVGALFAGNARLARQYSRPPRRRLTRSEIENSSPEELVHLLAYPGASSHPLSDVLFTGPRLVGIGGDHLRKAWRLWRLDVESCSRLLGVLASYPKKVPLTELAGFSGARDADRILPQLADIEGVVALHNDPPGLSLTSDLRRELNHLARLQAQSDNEDDGNALPLPAISDPDEFPGMKQEASLEEFEMTYRRWLRETARPGTLGSRQVDRNVEAVTAAYQAFLKRRASRRPDQPGHNVERVWERYKQTGS